MAQVGIAELLEAGVHFGHQTRRWNPKMRRFIHGERGGIYIIDLLKTSTALNSAQEFAGTLAHRGGTVLGPMASPLGAVVTGAGNRAGDGFDGAVQGSVVATYMHGPCLARNPELADLLLSTVVGELAPLDLPEVELLRRERLAAR